VDEDADQKELEEIVTKRVPIEIDGKRYYSESVMKTYFGWWQSGYRQLSKKIEHSRPLPNIAVGCQTPILSGSATMEQDENKPDSNKQRKVYVLSVIGLAFDTSEQPDFKYYFRNHAEELQELEKQYFEAHKTTSHDKYAKIAKIKSELKNTIKVQLTEQEQGLSSFYQRLFAKIWAAALKRGATAVVLTGVGLDASKKIIIVEDDYSVIMTAYVQGLIASLVHQDQELLPKIYFREDSRITEEAMKQIIDKDEKGKFGEKPIKGDFPGCLNDAELAEHESVIFVNEWDPHSLIGNGNARDTALAVLGWRETNPLLETNRVSTWQKTASCVMNYLGHRSTYNSFKGRKEIYNGPKHQSTAVMKCAELTECRCVFCYQPEDPKQKSERCVMVAEPCAEVKGDDPNLKDYCYTLHKPAFIP